MSKTEIKTVTLRLTEEQHRMARMKLAQTGEQFQNVLCDLLMRWVDGRVATAKDTPVPAERYSKEKALLEQALDLLPEYTMSQLVAIEHLMKIPPTIRVPHEKKNKNSGVDNNAKADSK